MLISVASLGIFFSNSMLSRKSLFCPLQLPGKESHCLKESIAVYMRSFQSMLRKLNRRVNPKQQMNCKCL